MPDDKPGWYARGGYIDTGLPEIPDALLPRIDGDHIITREQAMSARPGVRETDVREA